MAPDATQVPTTTPAPVTTAPAAPDVTNAPASAVPPDLSGSTPQPDRNTAILGSVDQAASTATSEYQKATTAANKPLATDKPVPHARLLGMIQGLAAGLSGAGTAIATHGRAGGAEETADILQKEQQTKIEAQQAAQAQKNQEVQQHIMLGDTAMKQMQNVGYMAVLPAEISKSQVEAQAATQGLQINEADFRAAHMGMSPDEFNAALSGNAPPDSGGNPSTNGAVPAAPPASGGASASGSSAGLFSTHAQQVLTAATKILGPNDPYVQKLQTTLANSNASPRDLWTASQLVESQEGMQGKVIAAQTAQQAQAESAPFGDKADALNAAMLHRYQVLNPRAKTLPAGFTLSADSTPKDFDRVDKIMQQTENAQSTQATRDLSNQVRQQTLDLLKGPSNIDPTVTGQAYLDQLKTADPTQYNVVSGYGSGRLELTPQATRTAQGQALLRQIVRAYPDFDPTKAASYAAVRKDFTSGKTSTAINSYNTAIAHLGTMFDHVSGTNTVQLNNPASDVHRQLDLDKQLVSTELAKAVSNGNMSEGEKNAILASISGLTTNSYKTRLQEAVSLLNGKLSAFQNQWDNSMVKGVDPPTIVSDASKGVLQHITGQGRPHQVGDTVVLKNGQTVQIKTINPDGTFTY